MKVPETVKNEKPLDLSTGGFILSALGLGIAVGAYLAKAIPGTEDPAKINLSIQLPVPQSAGE